MALTAGYDGRGGDDLGHGRLKSFLEKQETDEGLQLLWADDVAEHVHGEAFLHRVERDKRKEWGTGLRPVTK